MYKNDDLIDWLLESQPELLIKFEKDRIGKELRIKITQEIFNYYKKKKIWIDWNKFNLRELGKFASDNESIEFLIEEATKEQHYTTISNSLEILGFVETNNSNEERIINVLLNIIQTSKVEIIITRALNALIHRNFNDKDEIESILKSVDYSNSQYIRACLYHLIAESGYSNYFVDFLIDGIQYIRPDYKNAPGRTTLVDEGFYLSIGIENITSEESLLKLLEYYIKNPKDLSEVSFRDKTIIKMANNISGFIKTKDSNVFNLSYKLLITLTEKYLLDYTKNFFICFTESKMDMEVFEMILHSKLETGIKFHLLAIIANNSSLTYLIEKYNSQEITDEYIDSLKNFLVVENNELLKEFESKLKNETEYKEPTLKRNYEEERKKQRNREIEMFYNKANFEKEISRVFEIEKKEEFTNKDIREIEIKNWESQNYTSKALQIIENFSREGNANLVKILGAYKNVDFDMEFVGEIYSHLTRSENANLAFKESNEYELEEKHIAKVKQWCYEHVNDIDFNTALIIKKNKERSTSSKAIYLQYFLQKFNLNYEENTLLDLLSFDFYGWGIDYLEEKLDFRKMKERIIKNLKSGNENEFAIW